MDLEKRSHESCYRSSSRLQKNIDLPITPIDLDTWNLDDLEVSREWQSIDILLRSGTNHLSIIIENKVDTREHSDQLERYWQAVRTHFPSDKVLAIYLNPDGEKPSHEEFIALDYEQVATTIEALVASRASTLGPDIRTLMSHYTQMLRRHIVSESEIADLCRRIYRKHSQAIDLIVEHRPDQQATLRELLEKLVQARRPELIPDHSTNNYIRFTLKPRDVPALQVGEGWTPSGKMLLFEFQNNPESLSLKLTIGPGPRETRERLLQIALQNQPPFNPVAGTLNRKYNTVYAKNVLSAQAYSDGTEEELQAKIHERWEHFLKTDLPLFAKIDLG